MKRVYYTMFLIGYRIISFMQNCGVKQWKWEVAVRSVIKGPAKPLKTEVRQMFLNRERVNA